MGSFEALGVSPVLVAALRKDGIETPFPIQALTMTDALAGRDVCGQARTGSGKTLAFSIPMVERIVAGLRGPNAADGLRGPNAADGLRGPNAADGLRGPNAADGLRGPNAADGLRGPNAADGLRGPNAADGLRGPNAADGLSKAPRGLVLVPTRELAVQVTKVLRPLAKAAGLRVIAVYGGVSLEPQKDAARQGLDIVVATPGRLIDLVDNGWIRLDEIAMAVIDEADRMADMGFLPQVDHLLRRFHARKPQYLLFSATLDGQVGSLVRRYLDNPVRHEVTPEDEGTFDLTHRFLAVHHMDRVRVAAAIAGSTYRTLVFVRTKRGADRLAHQLQKEQVNAAAIHGDLRQAARERALKNFAVGKLQVLVATDVAARGIHVDDIDVVIHFDPPEDHKAYVHRSGRTARAGRGGVVATFVLWNQVIEVERLKRHLRISDPVVEVFSNDPRLADLATLAPAPAATAS